MFATGFPWNMYPPMNSDKTLSWLAFTAARWICQRRATEIWDGVNRRLTVSNALNEATWDHVYGRNKECQKDTVDWQPSIIDLDHRN